jgi:hypothetical protein
MTWLLAITRNVALDELRMRRQVPVDPNLLFASVEEGGDSFPGGDLRIIQIT